MLLVVVVMSRRGKDDTTKSLAGIGYHVRSNIQVKCECTDLL
jgi:hypothetical protein